MSTSAAPTSALTAASQWRPLLVALMLIMTASVVSSEKQKPRQRNGNGNGLLSIIMPVYNRPALLNLALEQIGHTNYEGNMEIIVMDDSEKTTTTVDPELLSKLYLRPHQTLVYQHLDGRVTVGEKRNMACEKSKGHIVVMMDDDDIYHPDRISYQIEPIEKGVADMTVLLQDVWLQVYAKNKQSPDSSIFFRAKPKMAKSVHYGTLAFRKSVWNPNTGLVYTDASLLDEVNFYNKVKTSPDNIILELPNNGMHIYVRHLTNINQPGTDLAHDPRFTVTIKPSHVPDQHVAKLEKIVNGMKMMHQQHQHGLAMDTFKSPHVSDHRVVKIEKSVPGMKMHRRQHHGRGLQQPLPDDPTKCGACVDVDGCVTADECWDMYSSDSNLLWGMCMEHTSEWKPDLSCSDCEKSSDDICVDRCVSVNGPCKSLADCYDMYVNFPDIGCDRFPTCDCSITEPHTSEKTKCGACVNANGSCVTADECWDISSAWQAFDVCMYSTEAYCNGCMKSSNDICDNRCIKHSGICTSFDDCYDMYAMGDVGSSFQHDCSRFPSCDCSDAVERTTWPTPGPDDSTKCGACVDVNGCVTADDCWDMYSNSNLLWGMCMDHTSEWNPDLSCSDCKQSSDDICVDRCVSANGPCKSLADCYDMYADNDIKCDRFPSCDCVDDTKPTANNESNQPTQDVVETDAADGKIDTPEANTTEADNIKPTVKPTSNLNELDNTTANGNADGPMVNTTEADAVKQTSSPTITQTAVPTSPAASLCGGNTCIFISSLGGAMLSLWHVFFCN